MLSASPTDRRLPGYKYWLAAFLLTVALVVGLPRLVSQGWQQIPKLEVSAALSQMQKTGLSLPGWRTLEQRTIELGAHKWSVQTIAPETETATPQNTAILMLRPQTWERDRPQIEWTDVNGARRWTVDSRRSLAFDLPTGSRVQARWFRGWTKQRTFAVVQWYAWASGGSAAPSRWFWVDQALQLQRRQRAAWVGVSLLLPMPPLGNLETAKPESLSLAKLVQTQLAAALSSDSTSSDSTSSDSVRP